jgi:hypothetical protein
MRMRDSQIPLTTAVLALLSALLIAGQMNSGEVAGSVQDAQGGA